MFDRITFDPQIMGGRACIRGMRIPVSVIVGQIAHGATFDEIIQGYPDLEKEDIKQAVEYAAWLSGRHVYRCPRRTLVKLPRTRCYSPARSRSTKAAEWRYL